MEGIVLRFYSRNRKINTTKLLFLKKKTLVFSINAHRSWNNSCTRLVYELLDQVYSIPRFEGGTF